MDSLDSTRKEILEYAVKIREIYPNIQAEELSKALEAKFMGGKDILGFSVAGCIHFPLIDFVRLAMTSYKLLEAIKGKDQTAKAKMKRKLIAEVVNMLILAKSGQSF